MKYIFIDIFPKKTTRKNKFWNKKKHYLKTMLIYILTGFIKDKR